MTNFVGRFGYKSDILLKKSYFLSKILVVNPYKIPSCKRITVIFPLREESGMLRSSSVMLLLEFLEEISGQKAIIKKAHIIAERGLWVRGQVDLSSMSLGKFIIFFNEYLLEHPLRSFSSKLPMLRVINKNTVQLKLLEMDYFFDTSTRMHLPKSSDYWLELHFFFDNTVAAAEKNCSVQFYIQYFMDIEWQNS